MCKILRLFAANQDLFHMKESSILLLCSYFSKQTIYNSLQHYGAA